MQPLICIWHAMLSQPVEKRILGELNINKDSQNEQMNEISQTHTQFWKEKFLGINFVSSWICIGGYGMHYDEPEKEQEGNEERLK